MKRYGKWLTTIGAAVVLTAIVGGHFLQYVIGNDNASVFAAITGAVGGSCLIQGLVAWKTAPRPLVTNNNIKWQQR